VCIGCKACEVACKTWNAIPEDGLVFTGMSMDNSQGLGASTWRHVAFIEQRKPIGAQDPGVRHDGLDVLALAGDGSGTFPDQAAMTPTTPGTNGDFRWLMASDVCKHCTHAACPYGVIDQRKEDGRAWKCTLCYDRLSVGQEPACAKSCPTNSIQFGPLDELRERADARLARLHEAGVADARLYGRDPHDGVGGDGAFFLLLDEPEVYGLPPDPVVTTRDLPSMWKHVAAAAATLVGGALAAFVAGRRL
jgi:formate dehydrogenase iron-sulfur subunit